MREWIKALPLGLGLPVVIGAASIKPEDAASNLAAWLQLSGVEHVPGWLSAPGVDNRVIFGSFSLGVIYAFLVWGVPALRARAGAPESKTEIFEPGLPSVEPKPSIPAKPTIKISSDRGRVVFDYSTNNGSVVVGENDCVFRLAFSRSSNRNIAIYTSAHVGAYSNLKRLARVKKVQPGEIIRFPEYNSSSTSYRINIGEIFLAENALGYFMQGKIESIKAEGFGQDEDDEVVFCYQINSNGSSEFVSL